MNGEGNPKRWNGEEEEKNGRPIPGMGVAKPAGVSFSLVRAGARVPAAGRVGRPPKAEGRRGSWGSGGGGGAGGSPSASLLASREKKKGDSGHGRWKAREDAHGSPTRSKGWADVRGLSRWLSWG